MNTPTNSEPLPAPFVRLSYSMLSIANRDADRWGVQITWPEIRFKRCRYSGRRDYYATGATIIRIAWSREEFIVCLSLLGFGVGLIYLPNVDVDASADEKSPTKKTDV